MSLQGATGRTRVWKPSRLQQLMCSDSVVVEPLCRKRYIGNTVRFTWGALFPSTARPQWGTSTLCVPECECVSQNFHISATEISSLSSLNMFPLCPHLNFPAVVESNSSTVHKYNFTCLRALLECFYFMLHYTSTTYILEGNVVLLILEEHLVDNTYVRLLKV